MKKIFLGLLAFLFCFVVFAQKPQFRTLKDPKMLAGCFGEGKKGTVLMNLMGGELNGKEGAIFNFTGEDRVIPSVTAPKAYTYAFEDEIYKVYVKEKHLRKAEGCIERKVFSVKIIFKGKTYYYEMGGFCGC